MSQIARSKSAARRRSLLALTLIEREDISLGIAFGSLIPEIARRLDRAASTVSREVARHGGRPAYRAHEANDQAWDSAFLRATNTPTLCGSQPGLGRCGHERNDRRG